MKPLYVGLTLGLLLVLGLVGCFVILLVNPNAEASAVSTLTTIIGLAGVAGFGAVAINNNTKKVEQVQKQTNGTLSGLQAHVQALTAVATPEQVAHAQAIVAGISPLVAPVSADQPTGGNTVANPVQGAPLTAVTGPAVVPGPGTDPNANNL